MAMAMGDCHEEKKLAECWWLTVIVTEAIAVIMVMADSVAIAMVNPWSRPWLSP